MLAEQIDRVRRAATVREDWFAWLPDAKDQLFAFTQHELEISYTILSISLDDALNSWKKRIFLPAREQADVFAGLFDRLVGQIRVVLRALYDHGSQFGTFPNIAPLRQEFFRTVRARQIARGNSLFSFLMLRSRTRFLRKLGALEQIVADLHGEARSSSSQIAHLEAAVIGDQWSRLEMLHDDLNTSMRETTIVLKSFLCVLPADQMKQFCTRLLFLAPSTPVPSRPNLAVGATASSSLQRRHRNPAPSLTCPEAGLSRQHPYQDRDNSGSGDGIPSSRMRPDGIGGPNETN